MHKAYTGYLGKNYRGTGYLGEKLMDTGYLNKTETRANIEHKRWRYKPPEITGTGHGIFRPNINGIRDTQTTPPPPLLNRVSYTAANYSTILPRVIAWDTLTS